MYYCFNVVTNKEGIGEAVLIRALEPISGVELMKKRRGVENIKKLCAGPGRLVIAMGIGKEKNGLSLFDGELRIELPEKLSHIEVIEGERIGISKGVEMPHRFYLKGSMFVSR
jgi:DNA-3-methyladenine glycosylase